MTSLELIEQVVAELTGKTPQIAVEEDNHGAVITLTVTGQVSALIGKNGVTIDALRTLIKALGYNGKHRIKLRLHEQASPQPSA